MASDSERTTEHRDAGPAGGSDLGFSKGETVGRYRLIEPLGEGGMGVVWRAEQTEPVRREVALKLIKPGMDSKAVLARFEAERQALAMMDHQCIATVFDGGVTERGHPYFAMEHVRGLPITDHCDRHCLGLTERIELLIRVCQAVQHAHSKGVIHRDLKPSNILVEYADGRGTPKVIDFGVAKALNQRLTEATMFTEQGQMIGTPEYMSPEQAEMSAQDVDTRSDVYSLGVILYELLVGERPFEPRSLRVAGLAEIQRVIREVEPQKPSTRLSSLASSGDDPQAATKIVQARRTELRSLTSTLRRDLDWVVMRCLEKSRERRYQTANAVADELRRYLHDEPVEAGPPSLGYRVRKFVRRRRGPVAAAAVGLTLLLGGLAGTSYGLVEARRQGRLAEQAASTESELRALADERAEEAEQERQRAERQAYVANVRLAAAALDSGDCVSAEDLLDLCPPHLRGWEWDWVKSRSDLSIMVLEGGSNGVNWVSFSSDESMVVGACDDGAVLVWETHSGKVLAELRGHEDDVNSAVFSPDGTQVLTASRDSTTRLWDIASATVVRTFGHHPSSHGGAFYANMSADGAVVLTIGASREVRLWDAQTGGLIAEYLDNHSAGRSSKFSPDADRVLLGIGLRAPEIVDATSGAVITRLGIEPDEIRSSGGAACWSPDASLVAAGKDRTGFIWVCDSTTGEVIRELRGAPESIDEISFSGDGARLLCSSDDGTAYVWDVTNGVLLSELRGHRGGVESARFSPDGTRIFTASSDGTARIWDADGFSLIQELVGHTREITSAQISPTGSLYATASRDGSARLWDANSRPSVTVQGPELRRSDSPAVLSPTGESVVVYGISPSFARSHDATSGDPLLTFRHEVDSGARGLDILAGVEFDQSGSRLVTVGNNSLAIWSMETGARLHGARLPDTVNQVEATAIDPRADQVVISCLPDGLLVWEPSESGSLRRLEATPPSMDSWDPERRIWAHHLEYSPSGDQFATDFNHRTGVVQLWDSRSLARVQVFNEHHDSVTDLKFAPNGAVLASASSDGSVMLYRLSGDVAPIHRLQHDGPVGPVAFNQTGDLLATSSGSRAVRVWDVESGQVVRTLRGFNGGVVTVEFSPDGQRILTASNDRVARLWDPSTGLIVAELRAHRSPLNSAVFDRHGERIFTTDWDNRVVVWESSPYGSRYPPLRATRQARDRFRPDVKTRIEHGEDLETVRQEFARSSELNKFERVGVMSAVFEVEEELRVESSSLNRRAWSVVKRPVPSVEVAVEALEIARRAVAIRPDEHAYVNTLGVALYRAMEFEEALTVLDSAIVLAEQQRGVLDACDLVFKAMSLMQLDRESEAIAVLEELDRLVEERGFGEDEDEAGWRSEARALMDSN